ncbi:IS630 family transposase [Vibrio cholerae]|nr:IS630 family transposase [Vibrio cholerae]
MKITLTPQQKIQLDQMHVIECDSRVCDRIKAILLASECWSQAMISQALRIHESTVARHLSDYVLSEKLKPENGGSQSHERILKMNFVNRTAQRNLLSRESDGLIVSSRASNIEQLTLALYRQWGGFNQRTLALGSV